MGHLEDLVDARGDLHEVHEDMLYLGVPPVPGIASTTCSIVASSAERRLTSPRGALLLLHLHRASRSVRTNPNVARSA
jgi:hypothetical protein